MSNGAQQQGPQHQYFGPPVRTIGVDEVNYSPSIAGDCVVCALQLRRLPYVGERVKLADSKILLHQQRLAAFTWLQENSDYAIAIATVNEIRTCNVYQARNSAVVSAVLNLLHRIKAHGTDIVCIDGKPFTSELSTLIPLVSGVYFVVNGDETVPEISAASIIAKVYVDALFAGFGQFWPGYCFEQDHGSPSAVHKLALKQQGPSPYHRRGVYGKEWWKKLLGEGSDG